MHDVFYFSAAVAAVVVVAVVSVVVAFVIKLNK